MAALKIISWNVNGIRAVMNKGFVAFVQKEKPDILCIQETKARPEQMEAEQVDDMLKQYPHHYWSSAEKAGYAGTAIFSTVKPLSMQQGIGKKEHDAEGRILTLEFKEFYLVNVYVPNSGRGLPRLKYRQQWDKDFRAYLQKLDAKKPVAVCGDFNVAHASIDLANPKENYNKTAGYTQVEIDGLSSLLDTGSGTGSGARAHGGTGFIDTFRQFHKEGGNYTFWSYMFNARKKNIGWRIDYVLVSRRLLPNIKDAFILPEVMGSDHCPVGVLLALR